MKAIPSNIKYKLMNENKSLSQMFYTIFGQLMNFIAPPNMERFEYSSKQWTTQSHIIFERNIC